MSTPNYSVIIPTYNRSRQLLRALTALCAQNLSTDSYEILIADDGSQDDTDDAVQIFISNHPRHHIRYLPGTHGGPALARNRGIAAACGDILFFTDDDCIVPPRWMKTLLDGFLRYPTASGVGGWYQAESPELRRRYFQKYMDALDEQHHELNTSEIFTNIFYANCAGNTANVAYRSEVFSKLGGFDEALTFAGAVDWEFKKRVQDGGFYLLYLPYFVVHEKQMRLRTFFMRFFNQGRGRAYMIQKYRDLKGNHYYDFTARTTLWHLLFKHPRRSGLALAHVLATLSLFLGGWYTRHVWRPKAQLFVQQLQKKHAIDVHRTSDARSWFTYITEHPVLTRDSQRAPASTPFFSVVIPTYNRAHLLRGALEMLAHQTFSTNSYEMIVVDDGSIDETQSVLADFKRRYPRHSFRYERGLHAGPAAARNMGIALARGDLVCFTDDDCLVPPDWLATFRDGFQRYPNAGGVGGWLSYAPEVQKESIFARYWQSRYFRDWHHSIFECYTNNPAYALRIFASNTANICVRRSVLREVGGFRVDHDVPALEDTDLSFRILVRGYPLLYIPRYVIHRKPLNFLRFLRMCFNRGLGLAEFLHTHHDTLQSLNPGLATAHSYLASIVAPRHRSPQPLAFLHFLSWRLGMLTAERKLQRIPSSPAPVISERPNL